MKSSFMSFIDVGDSASFILVRKLDGMKVLVILHKLSITQYIMRNEAQFVFFYLYQLNRVISYLITSSCYLLDRRAIATLLT